MCVCVLVNLACSLLLLLGVVPDILTIGKPMGNGFLVSGVVTTPSVDDLHEKKAPPHYNTVSTQSQSTHTMPYHLYMHVLTYTIVHTIVLLKVHVLFCVFHCTYVHCTHNCACTCDYCWIWFVYNVFLMCVQFGGNAVSMAAAEAVLCIMEDEKLQENAT